MLMKKSRLKMRMYLTKVIYMPIVDLNNPDAEAFIEGYRQMKPVAMECCFSEVTPEVLRLLQKGER